MKLRYLLVTMLTIGALLYGALVLFLQVADKMETPISIVTISEKISVKDTIIIEKTEVIKPIETAVETPKIDTIAPVIKEIISEEREPEAIVITKSIPASNLYDANVLEQIVKKYEIVNAENWGEKIPGIVYKVNAPRNNNRIIFLTFNAYTKDYPELFNFLIEHKIKSTLFLTGVWVRNNPEQAKALGELSSLFEIENHGNKNIALSSNAATAYGRTGTENLSEAISEVVNGATAIKNATGRTPRYIRSFINYADNVVVGALSAASIQTIGFTVTGDGGGNFGSETIKNQILNASSGSIILLNINPEYPNILEGLKAAIEEIEKEKLAIQFEQLAEYEQYFEYIQ